MASKLRKVALPIRQMKKLIRIYRNRSRTLRALGSLLAFDSSKSSEFSNLVIPIGQLKNSNCRHCRCLHVINKSWILENLVKDFFLGDVLQISDKMFFQYFAFAIVVNLDEKWLCLNGVTKEDSIIVCLMR